MKRLLFPNPQMLLRIAQGDAYGLQAEYLKFPQDQGVHDQALKFECYGKHPIHSLRPGQYSDDTQMSIAVAETVMKLHSQGCLNLHESDSFWSLGRQGTGQRWFTSAFLKAFKRDPRDGYARHFQEFLESTHTVDDFLTNIRSDSDRNGAAMRAVPLGMIPETGACSLVATKQAAITHNTPGGTGSAEAVALASHFALYESAPLSAVRDFVKSTIKSPVDLRPWEGHPVAGADVGVLTARAVLSLLENHTNLVDMARQAIEWGGDTDSVLSIAWGIASARFREPLPTFFERDLEDGPYGRSYLLRLGERLTEDFLSV